MSFFFLELEQNSCEIFVLYASCFKTVINMKTSLWIPYFHCFICHLCVKIECYASFFFVLFFFILKLCLYMYLKWLQGIKMSLQGCVESKWKNCWSIEQWGNGFMYEQKIYWFKKACLSNFTPTIFHFIFICKWLNYSTIQIFLF